MSQCRVPSAIAALIALLGAAAMAAPAGAQQPEPNTLTVIGYGQARVTPKDRNSNESIKAAVEEAEGRALPSAIAEGRERAAALATAAGLQLGELMAVAELADQPFYGPFGPVQGAFGPGRYCGNIPRFVRRRDAQGRLRRVRRGSRRICRFPEAVPARLAMTFATG